MQMEKLTRKTPNGGYYIPVNVVTGFRFENDRYNGAFMGNFVDKLGRLEELELDEEQLVKLARIPRNRVKEFIQSSGL